MHRTSYWHLVSWKTGIGYHARGQNNINLLQVGGPITRGIISRLVGEGDQVFVGRGGGMGGAY